MPSSLNLLFQNLQVVQSILVEAEPQIRALGLEMKEFFLLYELDAFPYPAELARKLFLPKPSITFLIKRLEAQEFLTRDKQREDLRRYRLTMTQRGREVLDKAQEILDQAFDQRLQKLNDVEIQAFSQILARLS